jgi:hypothetical protein
MVTRFRFLILPFGNDYEYTLFPHVETQNVKLSPDHTILGFGLSLRKKSLQKIKMYSKNDLDCQTQGRLKLMIPLYVSEICHKFQIYTVTATEFRQLF